MNPENLKSADNSGINKTENTKSSAATTRYPHQNPHSLHHRISSYDSSETNRFPCKSEGMDTSWTSSYGHGTLGAVPDILREGCELPCDGNDSGENVTCVGGFNPADHSSGDAFHSNLHPAYRPEQNSLLSRTGERDSVPQRSDSYTSSRLRISSGKNVIISFTCYWNSSNMTPTLALLHYFQLLVPSHRKNDLSGSGVLIYHINFLSARVPR